MDTAFSTLHLPPGRRVAGWAAAASDRFVESSFEVLEPDTFDASMLHRDMADLSLTRILSAGHRGKSVTRSRQQAARAAEEFYLVSVQLEGVCAVVQGGREAVLQPGEFALYDTRRPYELRLRGDYQQAVLRIPRRTLTARVPHGDALVACAVAAQALPARMLVQMVRAACDGCAPLPAAAAGDIADALLGVLCAGLRSLDDGEPPPTDHERRLARVQAYVAQHLGDPGLGVPQIAQALGVSASYLHKLFRGQPLTLERWIRAQRLEACARALSDPRSAGRTLTQIAYGLGFGDAAHFSRTFRQRFGSTPSAYRDRQLSG